MWSCCLNGALPALGLVPRFHATDEHQAEQKVNGDNGEAGVNDSFKQKNGVPSRPYLTTATSSAEQMQVVRDPKKSERRDLLTMPLTW